MAGTLCDCSANGDERDHAAETVYCRRSSGRCRARAAAADVRRAVRPQRGLSRRHLRFELDVLITSTIGAAAGAFYHGAQNVVDAQAPRRDERADDTRRRITRGELLTAAAAYPSRDARLPRSPLRRVVRA